jgi:hypothetical protein
MPEYANTTFVVHQVENLSKLVILTTLLEKFYFNYVQ